MVLFHLFRAERDGVEAHLLNHRHESVRAGGREVLLEADSLNEIEVSIDDFLRRVAGEDLDQQGNDAFDDDSVALALEDDLPVHVVGLQPDAALASLDQIAFCLIALIEWWQRVAQIDQEGVFVHPIVEYGELVDDLVL